MRSNINYELVLGKGLSIKKLFGSILRPTLRIPPSWVTLYLSFLYNQKWSVPVINVTNRHKQLFSFLYQFGLAVNRWPKDSDSNLSDGKLFGTNLNWIPSSYWLRLPIFKLIFSKESTWSHPQTPGLQGRENLCRK